MVVVQSPANPLLQAQGFSNGLFTFSVSGIAGPNYIVQASTNLVDWQSIFTNVSPVPPFLWMDGDTASFNQRFYRILLGP